MARLNQKLGVPHFPPAAGQLLRASQFVGAKAQYKTFFAPGQPRDDQWCSPLTSDGGLTFYGYTQNPNIYPTLSWFYRKPTAWRPLYSLLKPPQVVHLNVNVYGAFKDIDGSVATLEGLHPPDPAWFEAIADYEPATTEHKRLLAAAGEAKAAIEAIRPGKTWVEVNDYWEGSMDNGGGYNPATFAFPDASFINDVETPKRLNMYQFNQNIFIDTPNPFVGQFYGTDFLGVYLGDNNFTHITGSSQDFEHTAVWLVISDALPKTVNYFHRYSEVLFPCDIGTSIRAKRQLDFAEEIALLDSLPPVFTLPYTTVESLDQIPPGAYFYAPDPFGGYFVFLTDPSVGATATSFQAVYGASPIIPSAAVFAGVAQWGRDHGIDITVPGDTLSVTASGLIARIAAHFRFDPDTGKDLG